MHKNKLNSLLSSISPVLLFKVDYFSQRYHEIINNFIRTFDLTRKKCWNHVQYTQGELIFKLVGKTRYGQGSINLKN